MMSNKPLVSIAMPVYNGADTLLYTLKSLVNQTYENWELYLVDDGSNDNTLEIARMISDSRILIINDGFRLGLAARLNQIIDSCNGKYLARLDADDIAYPYRLEKQVNYLDSHKEIDLLGTGAMVFGEKGTSIGSFPVKTTHQEICNNPWSGFYLAHPTWMGKINWFKKYYYREKNKRAEDQDLLLRSFKQSKFAALPEKLIGYRQDQLHLKKILLSRLYISEAFIREAKLQKNYFQMVIAPVRQLAKAIIDAFVVLSGLESKIYNHRALPVSIADVEEWGTVWKNVN